MFGVGDAVVADAVRTYVKLLRATHAVVAQIEPLLARECLTPTQLGVLEVLLHKGPLTHRDVARKVLISAGNTSDVIDKLAARGLVRRIRCTADRRLVRIALTPCGAAMIEALFPRHAGDVARAMGGLDRAELEQLGRLLRKLGLAAQQASAANPPACPPACPAACPQTGEPLQ